MLVLGRKIGERVVLPECNVSITILEIKGKRVRLGISAPVGVGVHREEIWKRLCDETVEMEGCQS